MKKMIFGVVVAGALLLLAGQAVFAEEVPVSYGSVPVVFLLPADQIYYDEFGWPHEKPKAKSVVEMQRELLSLMQQVVVLMQKQLELIK